MSGREPDNIVRLAQKHLDRYRPMLKAARAGNRDFREDELEHLVTVWEGVLDAGGVWHKLSTAQLGEVIDALEDELDGMNDDEAVQ